MSRQEMERDLVRAVYLHEMLRAQYGPGYAAMNDPDYVRAHSLMSKLSRELNDTTQTPLSSSDLDAMQAKYKDLPEHFSFDTTIIGSC